MRMGLALAAAAALAAVGPVGPASTNTIPRPEKPKPKASDTTPPDRLCVDRKSPHFDNCYTRIGVLLDGVERRGDVEEYCVSEGWVRVRQKNGRGRWKIDSETGGWATTTLRGTVHAFFKKPAPAPVRRSTYVAPPPDDAAHILAAEEKRARKAAKRARLAQ